MENTQVGQTPSNGMVQYSTNKEQNEKIATAVANSRAEQKKSLDSLFGTATSGINTIIVIIVVIMAFKIVFGRSGRRR